MMAFRKPRNILEQRSIYAKEVAWIHQPGNRSPLGCRQQPPWGSPGEGRGSPGARLSWATPPDPASRDFWKEALREEEPRIGLFRLRPLVAPHDSTPRLEPSLLGTNGGKAFWHPRLLVARGLGKTTFEMRT